MNSSSSKFGSRRCRAISAAAPAAVAILVAAGGVATPAAALGARPASRDCGECIDRPRVALASARERPVELAADDDDSRRGRAKHDNDKRDGDRRDNSKRDDGDKDKDKGDGRRSYGGPFDMSWGYGKGGPGDQRAPRPNEWVEVQLFMNRYSPRRQFALDQLPDGEKKESIKKFVFARYRSLQSLQRRDPTGFEQRLAQLVIEDEIFGVVSGWGAAGEEERGKLKQTLRDKVARLVDIDLQERQRRVEWLKRELAQQSRELEQDQGGRDDLIERRATRFAEWAERAAGMRAKQQGEKQSPGADAPPCPQGQGQNPGPGSAQGPGSAPGSGSTPGPSETPTPPAGGQKSR